MPPGGLAGGDWLGLAGGCWLGLAGGCWLGLAGGCWLGLAGGCWLGLAGGCWLGGGPPYGGFPSGKIIFAPDKSYIDCTLADFAFYYNNLPIPSPHQSPASSDQFPSKQR